MSSNPFHSLKNFNLLPKNNLQGNLYQENSKFSISDCKNDLQTTLEKLNQLQKDVVDLKTSKSDSAWNMKFNEMVNQQSTIESSIQKYKNPAILAMLKKLVSKRKRKRNSQKRCTIRLKSSKEKLVMNRKKLHKNTDEWVRLEVEKESAKQLIAEASKRSEIVLYAVNQKISDAERYLSQFDKLEKLRRSRQNSQPGKNANETSFTKKIDQLRNVWKDAVCEYKVEKDKLQSFLCKNTKPIHQLWNDALFGENFQSDSINTEAKTLQEFLEIRRIWDSYIVPSQYLYGSSVPLGWVAPNDKPLEQWGLYHE